MTPGYGEITKEPVVLPSRTTTTPRSSWTVLALCTAVLILEGYDIVVFGAVIPALLQEPNWDLSERGIGLLASVAVVGMLLGALLAGRVADRRGRRPVLVASVVTFSVGMLLCATASTPSLFAVGRLVVGVGAGILLPTAAALVAEFAPPGRKHLYQGIVFSGINVGGALSAVVVLALADQGFRAAFLVGVLPALLLVPVLLRWLPESAEFLADRRRATDGTSAAPAGSWRFLFGPGYARRTVLLWSTTFLSLLVLYASNTWLPVLMTRSGYALGSALMFLLVLNLGVVGGSLVASRIADRFGSRRIIALSFASAAVAFGCLTLGPPAVMAFALVAIGGAGAIGTQTMVNAFIAESYPTTHRAVALGSALGVGRLGGIVGPIYGAWLLTDGFSAAVGFYGFALPALLAALVIVAVPAPR